MSPLVKLVDYQLITIYGTIDVNTLKSHYDRIFLVTKAEGDIESNFATKYGNYAAIEFPVANVDGNFIESIKGLLSKNNGKIYSANQNCSWIPENKNLR